MLGRGQSRRGAAWSPAERAKTVRELVHPAIVEDKRITKVWRAVLLGGDVPFGVWANTPKGIVKLSRFGRDEVQRARPHATAVALSHCAAASDRKIRRVERETRCR
jgi:hypothetical protein